MEEYVLHLIFCVNYLLLVFDRLTFQYLHLHFQHYVHIYFWRFRITINYMRWEFFERNFEIQKFFLRESSYHTVQFSTHILIFKYHFCCCNCVHTLSTWKWCVIMVFIVLKNYRGLFDCQPMILMKT